MIDVGTPLRTAYFTALDGNVIVDGNPIPFVDEKLEVNVADQDLYVLFLEQMEDEGIPNKTVFVNEPVLRMRIVNVRKATNTKEKVEDVANQILTTLYPNRTTWNLTLSAPLKLTYSRYIGGSYNPLVQTQDGFQISKTLNFKNRITQ